MASLNGARPDPIVAVDAMGGDFAPHEVLKGAVEAQRRGVQVLLVGPAQVIEHGLRELQAKLPIADAPDVIAMDESVAQALRRSSSSLHVAALLAEQGEADAVVSCGNSAAIMGIALHTWGTQPGIDRPAFGGTLPARHGSVFILDIGANSSVKASNLVQFAVMGEVYVRLSRGMEKPRVGLLSNGTEATKGTKVVREAYEALQKLPDMNFVGNVEGNQVFEGGVDVVATDGFTGNVLLKTGEGVATEIFNLLRSEVSKDIVSKVAATALMPALTRIKRRVDYEEYGGVPVLGVNGVMVNCHGRSKAKAVTNGILLAQRMAREELVERIGAALRHDDVMTRQRRRRLVRALHLSHEASH